MIREGGNWAKTAEYYEQILDVINTYDPKGKRLMGNRRADNEKCSGKYIGIEIRTEGCEGEYPDLPMIESEYNGEEGPRECGTSIRGVITFLVMKILKK